MCIYTYLGSYVKYLNKSSSFSSPCRVCICIYTYMYRYIYIHLWIFVYVHIYEYISIFTWEATLNIWINPVLLAVHTENVYIHKYTYICMYKYLFITVHIFMCIYIYLGSYVKYLNKSSSFSSPYRVCICIYTYMYRCICIHLWISVYVHIYEYIYIYIHLGSYVKYLNKSGSFSGPYRVVRGGANE
jgi:cytochrome P450 family 4